MRIFLGKFFAKIFILLVVLSLTSFAVAEEKGSKQESVAKINGAEISNKDFNRGFAAALQQFSAIGWSESNSKQMAELKNKVLDRLINIELLHQQGERRGIVIEDGEVEEQYSKFSKQFQKNDDLQNFLKDNNFTEKEFKQHMKKNMLINKLQSTLFVEFKETVVVTDKEVKEFYDKNLDQFNISERIRASHILISVPERADKSTKKEARAKIEDIQKYIQKGDDFAELAKANSSCPSSTNGGDLGFFGRGQMVKPFEDAAFKLQTGEVSDIVETKFGYHLIKLTDKKEAETQSFEDVKAKIKDWLKQQQIDLKLEKYIEKIRADAKIERYLESDQ